MKQEQLITRITNKAAEIFPSFGGGQDSKDGNPIATACKDAPAMFALGVDISAAVRLTLQMSAQPDLLEACRNLMGEAVKIAENFKIDAARPVWAYIEDAADALAKAEKGE